MPKSHVAIGNLTSGANHKTQAQDFDAAMLAAGLVYVPVTGDLDPVSGAFTPPASSGTATVSYGTRLYRTDDAELGPPLYLQVEFVTRYRARYTTSTYYHYLHFLIRVYSDAGLSTMIASTTVGNATTDITSRESGSGESYFCHRPGYVGIAVKANCDRHNGGDWMGGGLVVAARTKDRQGNFTSDGWIVTSHGTLGTAAGHLGMSRYVAGQSSVYSQDGCTFNYSAGLTPSSEGAVQLQFPGVVSRHLHPFEELGMYYDPTSQVVGDILQVEVGGLTRDYVVLGQAGLCEAPINSTTSLKRIGLAMLWQD